MTLPGVTTSETARDTAVAINIRGLQDFGRVNVLIEGARQNFQRSGHNANGVFYIEPEMLKGVDITRGPLRSSTALARSAASRPSACSMPMTFCAAARWRPCAAARATRPTATGMLVQRNRAVKVGNFDILGQSTAAGSATIDDGSGRKLPIPGRDTNSALVKARWRPAPGHQITGTIIDYNSEFIDRPSSTSATRRDSEVHNEQYTLGYTFSRPDTPLLDFSAKVYRMHTNLSQDACPRQHLDFRTRVARCAHLRYRDGRVRRLQHVAVQVRQHQGGLDLRRRRLPRRSVATTDTVLEAANKFTPSGRADGRRRVRAKPR